MENLEELKKKYKELGEEIERLENQKKNKRWRANKYETYYYISDQGCTYGGLEANYNIDTFRYKIRNYFKTEEEAQEHLDNINTYYELKDLANELNDGEEIDWNDLNQIKYLISYNGTLLINETLMIQDILQIYCLDKDFLKIAILRIGQERLENLFKGE